MRNPSALLPMFGALVAACGQGSSGTRAPLAPLAGVFAGDQVSFTVADGRVGAFFLTQIQCSLTNGDPDHPEQCSAAPPAPPAVEAEIAKGAFLAAIGELTVQGTFDAAGHAKGVWTFRPSGCCLSSGTCCVASGNWEAWHTTWQDTHGPPDAGSVTSGPPADAGSASGDEAPIDPGGDLTASQAAALARVDWYRKGVGAPAIQMVSEINDACQAHADYYATHAKAYQKDEIPGGVHAESPDVAAGFTGEGFGDRMTAAGYTGQPGWEIIAFLGSPAAAVDSWMETVYHRIPIVSPDAIHVGYGLHTGSSAIDVMDFGRGASKDHELVVVYPWPDQTGVPRSWSGNEGPQPPAPKSGYPSGPVVTATTAAGAQLKIAGHTLTGPGGVDVPHVWHPKGANGFMEATWALYADEPLQGSSVYTVSLDGTLKGQPWSRTWSFTTAK